MKKNIYDFNMSAGKFVEDAINTPFDKALSSLEDLTLKFEHTKLENIANNLMEFYNCPVDGLARKMTMLTVGIPLFYSMKGLNRIGVIKKVGEKYDVYWDVEKENIDFKVGERYFDLNDGKYKYFSEDDVK